MEIKMETSLRTEMRNQRKKQNWFQNQRVRPQKKMKSHLWNLSKLLFGHTWSGKFHRNKALIQGISIENRGIYLIYLAWFRFLWWHWVYSQLSQHLFGHRDTTVIASIIQNGSFQFGVLRFSMLLIQLEEWWVVWLIFQNQAR